MSAILTHRPVAPYTIAAARAQRALEVGERLLAQEVPDRRTAGEMIFEELGAGLLARNWDELVRAQVRLSGDLEAFDADATRRVALLRAERPDGALAFLVGIDEAGLWTARAPREALTIDQALPFVRKLHHKSTMWRRSA